MQVAQTLVETVQFFGLPLGSADDLYNVCTVEDPTEHVDLASALPDVVQKLQARMAEYKKKYVPPNFPSGDPNSNPEKYDNTWTPGWC